MTSIGQAGLEIEEAGPRGAARARTLMMATLRRPGCEGFGVRLRNLSAGGAMAECAEGFLRGDRIEAEIRGLGIVPGRVVWKTAHRIGIAFDRPVEPDLALGATWRLWLPTAG